MNHTEKKTRVFVEKYGGCIAHVYPNYGVKFRKRFGHLPVAEPISGHPPVLFPSLSFQQDFPVCLPVFLPAPPSPLPMFLKIAEQRQKKYSI